ncbi:hypothetical protein PSSA1_v1c0050 [Candidatus Phytoplasma solani]|uniref:Uncharacterized protein n=1 Tax=Candidatus Phytoplasma solani TaxID=69896 RepID=A0A421NYN1_9MOLU|nr:hypothetical protein PSSA1_v1c0050 [Candidatus Phytoplasma solani]
MNIYSYQKKYIDVVSKKKYYMTVIITFIIAFFSIIESCSNTKRYCFSLGLFTRQNTLLIALFFLLSLNNTFRNSKSYSYISFICLMNCLTVVFFCLLEKEKIPIFLEHKILTSSFIFYYFFIDNSVINIQKKYIGLLYPLIYFVIIFVIGISNPSDFPYIRMQFVFEELKNNHLLHFLLTITFLFTLIMFLCLCSFMACLKNKLMKNKTNIIYIQTYQKRFYLIIALYIFYSLVYCFFLKT